jgi:hypothetical protein
MALVIILDRIGICCWMPSAKATWYLFFKSENPRNKLLITLDNLTKAIRLELRRNRPDSE